MAILFFLQVKGLGFLSCRETNNSQACAQATIESQLLVSVRSMEREKYLVLYFIWKSLFSLHKGLVTVITREVVSYGGLGCNSSRDIDRGFVAEE